MGFKCGIIGLPNVGKSTLFNALTESSKAEAANYPFATIEPNVGRVAVPDQRLEILGKIGKSKKIIPSYMDFVDIAGLVQGASKGEGLGNKFLGHIREVDAIAHVVRCFKNDNITHVSNSIDPVSDIETIITELQLSDIETLEIKKNSLEKKSKQGDKFVKNQISIIEKLLKNLSDLNFVQNYQYSEEDNQFINTLNLITIKPMLYICNVDENSVQNGNEFSKKVDEYAMKYNHNSVIVSASIESQIAELENNEEKLEMIKEMGLNDTTLTKVIKSGYDLLNLINYFTCGPKETRSWTINKNTLAPQAAGKIHTDFEKGFIRAETISYEDFIKFNGEAGSRDAGKLRQEGKDYIVKNGDVMHFLFNV
ncbi:redox-regulated ATPase YchF [Pelagibacteraceae bacterium]|nr:redox-regulated ATPase YchF [Pelagibacteraceae bacterium]